METLVSIAIGSLILSGLLSSIFAYRSLHDNDLSRTSASSGVRSGLDFMGIHIRQAGEKLNSNFPAVLVVDGGGVVPDQITIRKNILDEVAKVCLKVQANHSHVRISRNQVSGCTYSATLDIYNAWRDYRISRGGSVEAYIYDDRSKEGEFFTYDREFDFGASHNNFTRRFERDSGTWSRAYDQNSSFVYVLEEWRFEIDTTNDVLQVTLNNGDTNNIIAGVKDLQVEIIMQELDADGNNIVKNEFTEDDDWKEIQLINITLEVEAEVGHETKTRRYSSSFYPRNILSEDRE